jgi:hypothetical protein
MPNLAPIPEDTSPAKLHNRTFTDEEKLELFPYLSDSVIETAEKRRSYNADRQRLTRELQRRGISKAAMSRILGKSDRTISRETSTARFESGGVDYTAIIMALRLLNLAPTPPLDQIEAAPDESMWERAEKEGVAQQIPDRSEVL